MTAYSDQEGAAPSIITTPIYLDNIFETTRLYCKLITPPTVQPLEKRWPDVEVTIVVESGNEKPEPISEPAQAR